MILTQANAVARNAPMQATWYAFPANLPARCKSGNSKRGTPAAVAASSNKGQPRRIIFSTSVTTVLLAGWYNNPIDFRKLGKTPLKEQLRNLKAVSHSSQSPLGLRHWKKPETPPQCPNPPSRAENHGNSSRIWFPPSFKGLPNQDHLPSARSR